MISFQQRLKDQEISLKRNAFKILQVNLGKLCNLTCSHCHVEAGPTKTAENVSEKVANDIIDALERLKPETLDLTGGAPEMNPHFRKIVKEARLRNIRVIDRCNLSILLQPGYEDLASFLAEQNVMIVASLPCYQKENVDKQRGKGVFDDSIIALQRLNALGYGRDESQLILNLVYNPVGEHLPGRQEDLERQYKKELKEIFEIEFSSLYTITNMPITRYEKYLKAINKHDEYLQLLEDKFNPDAVEHLMCRDTISVGWDGKLYDCDFNQAVGLSCRGDLKDKTIKNITLDDLVQDEIAVANHCYGCTAGSGSSCQGALEE